MSTIWESSEYHKARDEYIDDYYVKFDVCEIDNDMVHEPMFPEEAVKTAREFEDGVDDVCSQCADNLEYQLEQKDPDKHREIWGELMGL
jgi:hypothetical protein